MPSWPGVPLPGNHHNDDIYRNIKYKQYESTAGPLELRGLGCLHEEAEGLVRVLEAHHRELLALQQLLVREVAAVVRQVARLGGGHAALLGRAVELVSAKYIFKEYEIFFLFPPPALRLRRRQRALEQRDVVHGDPGAEGRGLVDVGEAEAEVELRSLSPDADVDLGPLPLHHHVAVQSVQRRDVALLQTCRRCLTRPQLIMISLKL